MNDTVAEAVRRACLRAASEAYEDAGLRGLCAEGRFELALDAVRSLDLREVAAEAGVSPASADPDPAGGAAQRERATSPDEVGP